MKPRINYYKSSPRTIDAISAASALVEKSFTDLKLKALVELRVSLLNGCAYCIDLHSNQARQLGEIQQRLDCLTVWREVPFFNPRERGAFAWAESVTLVANTHAPEEVYDEVAALFSPEELVQLTAIIGLMNLWNRIAISFRHGPPTRAGVGENSQQPQTPS